MTAGELDARLEALARETEPPGQGALFTFLTELLACYAAEDPRLRPLDLDLQH